MGGWLKPSFWRRAEKRWRSSARSMAVRRGAEDPHARTLERDGELEWGLAPELDDDPERALLLHDVQDVFQGERLEVQAVGGVVVGRDRLRVAVDHDGLHAGLAEREGRVDARVVELDPLPDPVGAGPQDHDLGPVGRRRLVLLLVRRVEVGGVRDELGGAGVDDLERRPDATSPARLADVRLRPAGELGQPSIGEAEALGPAQGLRRQVRRRADDLLEGDQLLQLREEPGIDAGEGGELLPGDPAPHRLREVEEPVRVGHPQPIAQRVVVRRWAVEPEPVAVLLQGADRLLERLLERAPDGHDLADRLHLGGERLVGLRKLLEGPAGHLHHAVVDGRLEGSGGLAGDVVPELVEGVAGGQLGGDLSDRKSGGLGSEGGRSADPRVHLDHDQPAVTRIHRELDVRTPRLHADLPDDGEGRVAHELVFLVGQRQGGGDGDRVPRVDAHRVEVLDGADDDHVVGQVSHDLELELLPADDRLLDEDLADRTLLEPPADRPL